MDKNRLFIIIAIFLILLIIIVAFALKKKEEFQNSVQQEQIEVIDEMLNREENKISQNEETFETDENFDADEKFDPNSPDLPLPPFGKRANN